MWKAMGGGKSGEFCVYVQGMHRANGVGEIIGRAEADCGRHDGEGCRTAIPRQMSGNREQSDEDRSEPG